MSKIVERDYILDEGIIVIHHTIDALYQKYYGCIPKKIEKMVVDLFLATADLLDFPKKGVENLDILEDEFIRRVKYKEMENEEIN